MPAALEKTTQQAPTLPTVKKAAAVQISPRLSGAARFEPAEVLELMETSADGLTSEKAVERLAQFGPNEVAREQRHNWLQRLYLAARNPLVILLTVLAIISFIAPEGDPITGVFILVMVILGFSLRYFQETRVNTAATTFMARNRVSAYVVGGGQPEC